MILSAIFKIGCFILIVFALNLSAAESIIPHAFRISLIGATKIQLTENKSDTKCEVDKKVFKESGYSNDFASTAWIEFDRRGHTTCNLIPLEVFKSYADRVHQKIR